jgi:hypothetical protein
MFTRLPRLTLYLALATLGLGALYAVGKTDTLLILAVISGGVTVVLAILSAVFHRRTRVVLGWSVGGVVVSLMVVGLVIPAT